MNLIFIQLYSLGKLTKRNDRAQATKVQNNMRKIFPDMFVKWK